ncbi:MAG: ABC-F family ATP-binding cassette domain-containing protein [Oscillospiraceae bacterium]|jgi:ATP-binding cassette subfamily F protein 3|nr:ABC-F family ATP-binding cassette domain-containing protein [Oscillospiraceae bacterium]
MILLNAKDVRKGFGAREVLKGVSLTLQTGQRLGLVGVNGCGKTTLLKILAGTDHPDGGVLSYGKGLRVGYMEQNAELAGGATVWSILETVFEPVFKMESKLRALESRMAEPQAANDPARLERLAGEYQRLTDAFEDADGYAWRSSISGMLTGLGFEKGQFDQPAEQLSGGERTRLFLAKLLLEKPDVLLLDEPTNHLDLAALTWLEGYLTTGAGSRLAMIVVSHDRYFLDAVCTDIAELMFGETELYYGNYTRFQQQRAERYEIKQRAYDNQQKEIARQEAIIERFRRYNQEWSIRKAKTREKMLERMERLSRPRDERTARFSFRTRRRTGDDVLMARGLTKSFGDRTLFSGIDLHIRAGERVVLIGPNGAGKTTLLEALLGRAGLDAGSVRMGANVDIGYYDQLQSGLDPDKTALDEVWDRFKRMEPTEVRSALALFLFTGDDVLQKVSTLSGGERGRVALTILMLRRDNFLLLDEPTNHLDMDAREVLEQTLEDFEGTILTISHDRYFINRIADRVLELTKDGLVEYLGNYDDYLAKKNSGAPIDESGAAGITRTELAKRRKRGRAEQERARARKERIAALEETVDGLEKRIAALEERLADSALYDDPGAAADLAKEHRALTIRLAECLEEWEKETVEG